MPGVVRGAEGLRAEKYIRAVLMNDSAESVVSTYVEPFDPVGFKGVPLGNTIRLGLVCSASGRDSSFWGDLSMPLSAVTVLVRNLIRVPAAVLRSRAAKDAEFVA